MVNKAIDFIIRHTTWIAIAIVSLYIVGAGVPEKNTMLLIIAFEMLALGLTGFTTWAFTDIKFTKLILEGEDGKMNSVERHSLLSLIGQMFLGVHLLVAIIAGVVYLAQFG